MDQTQPIATRWKKPMFPEKSVRVLTFVIFLSGGRMFIVPWDNGSEEIAG